MEFQHKSVLLQECIDALNIRPDGIYLDGTLGGAGHSSQIARRLTEGGRLIGVDRDRTALAAAKERLAPYADRVTLVHSNFAEIDAILDSLGIPAVDGMLFDLGVSSPQLDDASRGFSYMADAPLDMRMDKDDALTAGEVVNTWPQPHDAGCGRPPQSRRQTGRHHLPFARGPHRQERDAAGGARLHLPAGIPGVRLRQKATRETRYAQAYRLRPRRAGGKSPRPEREAPRCGKTLTERMSHHGRPLSQQRLGGL